MVMIISDKLMLFIKLPKNTKFRDGKYYFRDKFIIGEGVEESQMTPVTTDSDKNCFNNY